MAKKSTAAWWARLARPLVREYQPGLAELAKSLPRRRGRVWTHGALSRFVATGTCTADLAIAISAYFDLPRPAFVARNVKEALQMEAVASDHDVDPPPGSEAEIVCIEERLAAGVRRKQVRVVHVGERTVARTARRR